MIVFIGFNKTGTRSFHEMMLSSGLRSVHWDKGNLARAMLDNAVSGRKIFSGYDGEFEAFSDLYFRSKNFSFEGNSLFRQIDVDYPQSKFIYNTREIYSWVKSRLNHPARLHGEPLGPFYMRTLGLESIDEVVEYWIEQRLDFEKSLFRYFAQSSDKLLTLDVGSSEIEKTLAEFLGIYIEPGSWQNFNQFEGAD